MNLLTVLLSISLLIIVISESKNFNRSLGTFILISLLVVGLAGVYSWMIKADQVDSLTYIRSLDWSDDFIFPDITPNGFATTVDPEQNLHIIWMTYHRGPERKMYLKHLATNPQGELVIPPHTVLEMLEIQHVSLTFADERLQIFWAGKGADTDFDLIHTQLDLQGRIYQQETVYPELFSDHITDLRLARGKDGYLLAWIDQIGFQYLVKSMEFPDTSPAGLVAGVQLLAQSNSTISELDLIPDQSGQFHLLWQEQVTQKIDHLYYQRLTDRGQMVSEAVLLDQGQLGTHTLATTSQEVIFAWDKRLESGNNPGIIFGTHLSLARVPGEFEVQRLTMEEHHSTLPALAATSTDQIYFTYVIRKYTQISSLAYQKYRSDLTPFLEKDEWVIPKLVNPERQYLLSGLGDDIHLFWFESHRPTDLQYVNNQNIREISPFEVVGIKTRNLKDSLLISLAQIFSSPIFDFSLYFIFFFNIVALGYTATILGWLNSHLSRKLNFKLLDKNLYLVTTLLCLIQIFHFRLVLKIFPNQVVIQLLTEHFWFIIISTLGAALTYIALNKIHDKEFMFGAFISIAWIYWVLLMVQVLNLPYINFTILPNI